MQKPFFFDPNKSRLFYLVLFVVLTVAGVVFARSLGVEYSIIGSVASFLGLFVAFQSWLAADAASRKTDETLVQMHQMAEETRRLVASSYQAEEQIRMAVTTISDSTRELFKGFANIQKEIRDFLAESAGAEFLGVMVPTASIGTFYAKYHVPPLNQGEMRGITGQIHEQLLLRSHDTREFYLATLAVDETQAHYPPASSNMLYYHYILGLWMQFRGNEPLTEAVWQEHVNLHLTTLRQIRESFELFAEHDEQKQAQVPPCLTLLSLPLQLFLCVDSKAANPYRAMVTFLGQYNLESVTEPRAMRTTDPELVRTLVSMFESITDLTEYPGYKQLRQKYPL
ncbi:hypothetical protein D3Y59_03325 [Hymenobacter oligotrophus]|uniref:Uncharacterized protein n=1 Tax=Hymenobacter oligotrophus TaxID=2319843 RepID=A0A3B7QT46_9BACT|nr:hypothetical protein [Hymenobacter oligotrophus]AYA36178.1 hypothetical protein D3Y59_03325 [Hymenobacter oligotrophus]